VSTRCQIVFTTQQPARLHLAAMSVLTTGLFPS